MKKNSERKRHIWIYSGTSYNVRRYYILDGYTEKYLDSKLKWHSRWGYKYLFETEEKAKEVLSAYFKKHPKEFAEYIAQRMQGESR